VRGFDEVAAFIRQHEVGRRAHIETPFGRRLVYYADLTATGRYLHFVERWINRVRPFYANTHTAVSSTGRIIGSLRENARGVVRDAVRADPDDEVLFCGSGATAAINKLVGLLGLAASEPLRARCKTPPAERAVVFIGPFEHHSNELPWVESDADVVEIGQTPEGTVDLEQLRVELERYSDRALKIGSFSAASNVTGVFCDVGAIAEALHRGGAYACFDYAAGGPYMPIDMHPPNPARRMDAIFLSVHKFIGGPEASGVLVANRSLFRCSTPVRPGGGTVEYVAAATPDAIDYTVRLDEREEGGTPDILGDVRAGTAFLVKQMIGAEAIVEHECALAAKVLKRLSAHPRISLLGSTTAPRLAILSFNVAGLHHDFVAGLLDHLFGIQNRAGCSCAGPYGHRLLNISREQSERFRALIHKGIGGVKPGWVRVTVPFYATAEDVEFLVSAIEFVADHGRTLVPLYELSWADGVWRHRERPQPDIEPIELTVEALEEAAQSFAAGDHEAPMSEREMLANRERYFEEARALVDRLQAQWRTTPPRFNPPTGQPQVDELCWFQYVYCDEVPQPPIVEGDG